MNKRIIVIIIGIIGILVIAVILLTKKSTPNSTVSVNTVSNNGEPVRTAAPIGTPFVKKEIVIPESKTIVSSGIEIKNVYKIDKATITPDKDVVLEDKTGFHIMYLSQFDQFLVTVLNPDFAVGRTQAERALLERTGTDEKTACKLNVKISTPAYVNAEYGGRTFGLSFCSTQ